MSKISDFQAWYCFVEKGQGLGMGQGGKNKIGGEKI